MTKSWLAGTTAALLLALPARAPAQSAFQVTVTPHVVRHVADTVALTYTVGVLSGTSDSLVAFIVDAPGVLSVGLPGSRDDWFALDRWRTRPIAEWVWLGAYTGANSSSPALPMTGRGLLGVVPYWAKRNAPLDSVVTDRISDTSAVYDTLIVVEGAHGSTIGVVAFPPDTSNAGLGARLGNLVGQVCALGWIDNQGICTSLRAKATPAPGPLGAFIQELDAQRGKHVNESAYLLLSDNATYLLHRL